MLSYMRGSPTKMSREDSAKKLQIAARARLARRESKLEGPSLAEAIRYKDSMLAHEPSSGALYDFWGPLTPTFDLFGAGVVAYMQTVAMFGRHFWVIVGFALSNLVSNFYGGALGADRNLFNIGTIGNAELTPSYGMMEFVISLYLVRLLYKLRAMIDYEARRIDEQQSTPADFALQLDGLPADADDAGFEARVRAALNDMEPGLGDAPISHTGVSLANREYVLALDAFRTAQDRREDLQATLADTAHGRTVVKLREEFEKQTRVVDRLRAEVKRLEAEPSSSKCSGVGFVVFERSTDATAVLECTARGAALRLAPKDNQLAAPASTIAVSRPPEPDDVTWENLPCSWWEVILRQLLGTTIVLITAFAGTALISVAQYLTPTMTKEASGVGELLVVQLLSVAAILTGNLAIFLSVPPIEANLMRHKTHGAKELSIVLKLIFFQVFNTSVASAGFLLDSGDFNRAWYAQGAPLVLQALVGDFFVINLCVDLLQPGVLIGRYVVAPLAITQKEMNSAYATPADIFLAFRLQLIGKFVVLSVLFGSAMPGLYVLTACFLTLVPLVDRFNLLRRLVPPARTSTALSRGVVVFVLPLALLLRLLICVGLYRKLSPPPGESDDEIAEAQAIAVGFVYAALAVCGPAVLYFMQREWRAELGCAAQPPAEEKRNLLTELQKVMPSDHRTPAEISPNTKGGAGFPAGALEEDSYHRTHAGALDKSGVKTYMAPRERALLARVTRMSA